MKKRLIKPSRAEQARAPDKQAQGSEFFNCRLTRGETAITVIAIVISVALQCKPVLESLTGIGLVAILATISWLTPVTGFLFIACAQSLPSPAGMPLNPAQLGFVTWIFTAVVRYRRLKMTKLHLLWPVLPWLIWFSVLTGEPVWDPRTSEYFKAVLYAMIACQLINEAKGQYLKCLLGLCIGGLTVVCAFWGFSAGLPVELSDWGGEREGFTRLGGARVDSIMLWPPIIMGVFGVLGITFTSLLRGDPRQARNLSIASIIVFILALPPLFATMSNAAFLGFGLMTTWAVLMILSLKARGMLTFRLAKNLQTIVFVLIALVVVSYYFDVFSVQSRTHALKNHYDEQSKDLGAMASRTSYWSSAIESIAQHPFSGRAFAENPEPSPPGKLPGEYLAHNVFLDYGRFGGLPSMFLLIYFFAFPAVGLWRLKDADRYIGPLMAYAAMFIFWMVLSFPFYKTFWALWMLMAMTADAAGRTQRAGRIQPRVRRRSARNPVKAIPRPDRYRPPNRGPGRA